MSDSFEEYILQIKSIPILDVCQYLGIKPETRGRDHWCKIRPEKHASTVIHTDKNIFHDFGLHKTGDVISLVSFVQNIPRKEAIAALGLAFGIERPDPHANLSPHELTNWEYAKIGLYGDSATKNFSFNPDRQTIERIHELSQKYSMPLNQLRKSYSKIYERLIRERAIPFVRERRNEYYVDVYTKYNTFRLLGSEQLFYSKTTQDWFLANHIKELQSAERFLNRACIGTSLQAQIGDYDAIKDLQKIQRGELKPELCELTFTDMTREAKQHGSSVSYQTVDFSKFMSSEALSDFTHSAFLKKENVVVRYLDCDEALVKPILDNMKPEKQSLKDQIENIHLRRHTKNKTEIRSQNGTGQYQKER